MSLDTAGVQLLMEEAQNRIMDLEVRNAFLMACLGKAIQGLTPDVVDEAQKLLGDDPFAPILEFAEGAKQQARQEGLSQIIFAQSQAQGYRQVLERIDHVMGFTRSMTVSAMAQFDAEIARACNDALNGRPVTLDNRTAPITIPVSEPGTYVVSQMEKALADATTALAKAVSENERFRQMIDPEVLRAAGMGD